MSFSYTESETCCAIWYHLLNLKNVKNFHGGVLLLESNTPPWSVFLDRICTFFCFFFGGGLLYVSVWFISALTTSSIKFRIGVEGWLAVVSFPDCGDFSITGFNNLKITWFRKVSVDFIYHFFFYNYYIYSFVLKFFGDVFKPYSFINSLCTLCWSTRLFFPLK